MQAKSVCNLSLLVACSFLLMLYATQTQAAALPMDLYDDVSDFFDAMSLDEVVNAASNKNPEEFCRMPARKGVCRALIPRWSYDAKAKDCIQFNFGGCDGNENNFGNYQKCMDTCKGM